MKLTLSGRIVESSEGSAMTVPDFIRMAKETGYDGVDLRYSQIGPDAGEDLLSEVEAALADCGIEAALLNAGGLKDEESLQGLLKIADAAERLGCSTIRASGSDEMCQRAADLMAPRGIRLCSQIHTGGDYETIALTKDTLARIGRSNFGVIAEPANLLLAGQPRDEASLAEIADSIFGVNMQSIILVDPSDDANSLSLRDGTTVYYTRVPLSENTQLDLAGFLAGLKAAGFDGFINVLEPRDPEVESAVVARRTAETIRPMLG